MRQTFASALRILSQLLQLLSLREPFFFPLSFCPFFFAGLSKNSRDSSATLSPFFATVALFNHRFSSLKKNFTMEMAVDPYMELRNAKSTKRRQSGWYTAAEVGTHCTIADCWITIQGIVYDLTSLLPKNPEVLNELIVKNAGKDVSHWFEPRSFLTDELQVVMYFHPVMRINTFYTPLGRFTHIPPLDPRTDYAMDYEKPWWQDPAYIIGQLSYQTRLIRIKNVLLDHTYTMEVPCEESISQILIRYADNNAHAMSYEWKAIVDFKSKAFSLLDMAQCLSDNGVINESKDFGEAGMELDFLIPVLHVHYTDDFTVA